jgi:hypothetical protein
MKTSFTRNLSVPQRTQSLKSNKPEMQKWDNVALMERKTPFMEASRG